MTSTSWLCLLLLALGANAAAAPRPTPMVDGDCAEYAQLGAARLRAGDGIDLYLYDDEHYVWMCYTYPQGSMGQLDMVLKTARLEAPLNLHASAQLGEWPVGRDDLVPRDPQSDKWWNQHGWTANTVWVNGIDTSGTSPRFRLRNAKARELQLSKQRFGHGDWQFSMTIYQVKDAAGGMREVRFPADGSFYTFKTR